MTQIIIAHPWLPNFAGFVMTVCLFGAGALSLSQWKSWLSRNYVTAIIAAASLLGLLYLVFYASRLPAITNDLLNEMASAAEQGDHEKLRNYAYAFAALSGAMIVLATLPFTLIKTWLNERQTKTSELTHIGDSIAKAVEQLSATQRIYTKNGEQDQPNETVRTGGVISLENIGKRHPEFAEQCLRILVTHAQMSCITTVETSNNAHFENRPASSGMVKTDLHAALCAVSALFDYVNQDKAPSAAYHSYIENLNCQSQKVLGGNFRKLALNHANFSNAALLYVDFHDVIFSASSFYNAKLSVCSFSERAELQTCELDNLYLWKVKLSNDCGVTQNQLDEMFGHENCEIPEHLEMPNHWSKINTSETSHRQAYSTWSALRGIH